eukprot:m.161676 g.161676  ORF g.161676 m.161676 type:complete len:63 (-) comp31247_c0_seq2:151-339(-)
MCVDLIVNANVLCVALKTATLRFDYLLLNEFAIQPFINLYNLGHNTLVAKIGVFQSDLSFQF